MYKYEKCKCYLSITIADINMVAVLTLSHSFFQVVIAGKNQAYGINLHTNNFLEHYY